MRYFLDNDVPVSVAKVLRDRGHDCWTAAAAGLAEAQDDALTVYATEQNAALVTLDREFSQRRKKNSIGRHVWLNCIAPDAADALAAHLNEVEGLLHDSDVMVTVTKKGVKASVKWD